MRLVRRLLLGIALCLVLPAAASAATPTLTVVGSAGEVGGTIHATATLSDGENPTGAITFKAFGPSDPSCAGSPLFTDPVPVSGNGEYTSGDTSVLEVGTYHWSAEYSGDGENDPASSSCVATSTVTTATPSLTSIATNGTAGGTIADAATVSGGFNPTGTLTFKAFGPADATCAGAAAFTGQATVSGNGGYGSGSFANPLAGSYRWTIEYSGDPNNSAAVSPCNAPNETSAVGKATPGISTTATNGTVGGTIKDTATISAGVSPTGNIAFKAFGPNDATCAGAVAFTKTVTVSGNAAYDSTDFATAAAGSYRWTAEYSGDANNNAATSACNASNETSTVAKVTPTLSSVAANGTAGGSISDSATLASGFNPTGTLTFKAFGPADESCSNAAAFTKAVTVAGNGNYGSTGFAGPLAGAYRWTLEYSGDANNNAVTSPCNAPNETSTVGKATPGISTTATNGIVGGTIKDTATIASGAAPTGSVVFKAFGPNDTNCTGVAAFTKTVTVSGNAAYDSTNFTTSATGTYRWTAEYSGDANNNAATSPCNAANETSTVSLATPILSSTATNGTAGATIKDTATLAAGFNPTGTLTFNAYGPSNPTCTGAAAFTKAVAVAGNGSYDSTNFNQPLAGSYNWTISYTGDANNNAVTSGCNSANETSTVAKAAPTLSSTATNGTAGGTIKDSATLAAGFIPTGTLTFKAFGPADATCAGAAAFTKAVTVASGNGSYESTDFAGPLAGSYRWTIEYSGDANNAAVTSGCNASNETSTVGKASPGILASATNGVLGGTIKATAALSAGAAPTGQVVFKAFAPGDGSCATPVFNESVPVAGSGSYDSPNFSPVAIGTYRWTAEYSGDANNNAGTSSCSATSTVGKASPSLTSVAASTIFPGSISDSATLAAGFNPGGTLTFKAFGPENATCTGAADFTKAITVASGNSSYGSTDFKEPKIGSYRWIVEYTGDANNNAVTSPCNAANETSTVAKVPPALSVTTANAAIGGAIASFATFGGGLQHGGQVIFRAYSPTDPTCVGAPAFASTVPVTASNDTYASGQFTPRRAGAFRWTVSYSGDEKNAAETTPCTAVASVAPATPTLAPQISATQITIGDGVRNTVALSAGFNPTGTLTFNLYGPGDTSCSGTPALSGTATVTANGSYTSAALVPSKAGDYRFTVGYSGDDSNSAVASACGAGGQYVQVQKRTPTLKGRAAVKGKKLVVRATLAGAASPHGKISFRVYAPGDSRCSKKPAFSSQAKVTRSGDYSAGYLFKRGGLYHFAIAYSGDERNLSVKKGCATRGQSIRVP